RLEPAGVPVVQYHGSAAVSDADRGRALGAARGAAAHTALDPGRPGDDRLAAASQAGRACPSAGSALVLDPRQRGFQGEGENGVTAERFMQHQGESRKAKASCAATPSSLPPLPSPCSVSGWDSGSYP